MMILYFLIKLFKLYEQGKIFALSNVKYLKKIGICMLINQEVSFIYEALISFVLTLHNPAGHHTASISFGTYDIYNIVMQYIGRYNVELLFYRFIQILT